MTLKNGPDELYVHIADSINTMLSDGARLQLDTTAGDDQARSREQTVCLRARNYRLGKHSRDPPSGAR